MQPVLFLILLLATELCLADEPTPPAGLGSEIPSAFTPKNDEFDYVRRDVMIPMRDGIKLYTVILIPKGAQHTPILLSRTPYGAEKQVRRPSKHLAAVIGEEDVVDELVLNEGYIRVIQDIRGKHKSEGEYVMNRPLCGPLNPTNVDHSTYLRHDRLAGEKSSGVERKSGNRGDFLCGVYGVNGVIPSPSCSEGRDADQSNGRWLDGR